MKTLLEQSQAIRSAGARLAYGHVTSEGVTLPRYGTIASVKIKIGTLKIIAREDGFLLAINNTPLKNFDTEDDALRSFHKIKSEDPDSFQKVKMSDGARLAGEKWGPWKRSKDDEHFKPIIIQKFDREGTHDIGEFTDMPNFESKYVVVDERGGHHEFKDVGTAMKTAEKMYKEWQKEQKSKAKMSAGSRLAAPIKLPANTSFTVYQVKPDGSLSGKEHLNDADEVSEWYARKNYGQICVVNDKTGEKKYFQDSGQGLKEVRMSGRPFDGELQPQPNELPGGLGDGLTPADVDPVEFDIGMEMEKEHTPDEATRQEIVLDHLAEDPAYYSKLKQMEGQGVDVQMFGQMRATKL